MREGNNSRGRSGNRSGGNRSGNGNKSGGGNRRGGNRNSRGGNRGGGGGNRGGNGNWRGRRRRNGRDGGSHKSGNLRERIAVESGHLVIIDQFMLANPQFQEKLFKLIEEDPSAKNELIKEYGGIVVELEPSNYRILRNPYSNRIVIHDSKHEEVDFEEVIANASEPVGDILIDTRCLAMIDRELLDDTDLLEKYQQLWFSDKDKACRDLLRDNGGAVRYGFQRFGDELEVYH